MDEPGCGGLVRLSGCGLGNSDIEAAIEEVEKRGDLCGMPLDAPLLLDVCTGCEYFVDGCDFRDPDVPRESCSPCGGLKAVALLARKGLLP